jgi:hypothetical protein
MRAPPICLRELTAEEAAAVESLTRSRTAAARRVEPGFKGSSLRKPATEDYSSSGRRRSPSSRIA